MIFSNETQQSESVYRIVQFDEGGEYYAFDETIEGEVVCLDFDRILIYAKENCMNNNFDVGWRIEKL